MISKYDVSSSKSSIHSLHARPTSRGFYGVLNDSIFSDFPALSTLVSVGFGACSSAPDVSGMISYRVRSEHVVSSRVRFGVSCFLFLVFFRLNFQSLKCLEVLAVDYADFLFAASGFLLVIRNSRRQMKDRQ